MLTNARSPIILNRTKKETPNKSRRSHLVYNHTQFSTQLSNFKRKWWNPKFGIGIRNQRMKFLPRQEIYE